MLGDFRQEREAPQMNHADKRRFKIRARGELAGFVVIDHRLGGRLRFHAVKEPVAGMKRKPERHGAAGNLLIAVVQFEFRQRADDDRVARRGIEKILRARCGTSKV